MDPDIDLVRHLGALRCAAPRPAPVRDQRHPWLPGLLMCRPQRAGATRGGAEGAA